MMYKRTFGKRGLVAVLAFESHLHDPQIEGQIEGACQQCGITQEYALDMFITEHDPEQTEEGAQDMLSHAATILQEGYKAVVTVGPQGWTAMELACEQLDTAIMHLGVHLEPYGDDEETFRVANLDEMFEKNMSPQDRAVFADQLPPDRILERLEEARKERRLQEIKAAGPRLVLGLKRPDGTMRKFGAYDLSDEIGKDEDMYEA